MTVLVPKSRRLSQTRKTVNEPPLHPLAPLNLNKNSYPGQIILLENLRFHIEEEGSSKDKEGKKTKADPEKVKEFRKSLTSLADIYISPLPLNTSSNSR
jgi:Phosphoglycerate kinase